MEDCSTKLQEQVRALNDTNIRDIISICLNELTNRGSTNMTVEISVFVQNTLDYTLTDRTWQGVISNSMEMGASLLAREKASFRELSVINKLESTLHILRANSGYC